MADSETTSTEEAALISKESSRYVLSRPRRFAYSVGHVLNDLCASMWFSYLLVFYHKVLFFNNIYAGTLMLIGQVSDAMCTPLIGYASDHSTTCRFGKRKTWHLLGVLCVMGTFIFIFNPVIGGRNPEQWAMLIYFVPFIVIFQFGWASTQISHLSLIPELTPVEEERVTLNAIRYMFTVTSNLFVYGICWILLTSASNRDLGPANIPQFRYLAIIIVGTGAIFSLIFHLGTKEPSKSRTTAMQCCIINKARYSDHAHQSKMTWKDWLYVPQFYQISLIYMCSRLMVNVSQVYMSMFVTESLKLEKTAIAIVPLFTYASGFVASCFSGLMNKHLGRKVTYFISTVVFIGGCGWLRFPHIGEQVYGAAILLGAGGSTLLVTSLALTSDLIAHNTESGAFVYGAMSFADKLSNGLVIMVIQYVHPCIGCCAACQWFYADVMVYVPGGAAVLALLILITLIPVNVGVRKKPPRSSASYYSSKSDNENDIVQCDECQRLFPIGVDGVQQNSHISTSSVQEGNESDDS